MDRLVLKNNDNLRLIKPRLPYEYQEVEWLESSGTQYIDTNVKPNLGFSILFDATYLESKSRFGTGCFSNANGRMHYEPMAIRDGKIAAYYGDTASIVSSTNAELGTFVNIRFGITAERITYEVDGIDYSKVPTQSVYNSSISFTLFAFKSYNGISGYGKLRFKDVKIYDAGNLIRHFVPCYNKSTKAPGMYDICGSTCPLTESPFYTNAGSGVFEVGIDKDTTINGIPDLVAESLQSLLISNCPLIDSLGAMASIYNNEEGGVANNLLANFYLQWPGIQEKDANALTMLTQIAQNKAVDGTTRVFHGMKLADGTVDDSIAPVIDGDLKMTGGIYMTSLDALGVDPSETEDYGEGLKRAFVHHFRDLRVIYDPNNMFIEFADPEVLRIALANWDTDHDGGISTGEAQAVGSMSGNGPFGGNTIIETFDELRYFTGMTYISGRNVSGTPAPFKNCTSLKRIIIPEGVLNVGMNTFNGCTALEEITFPASLQRIGYELATTTARNNAFTNCAAITKINYSGTPSQWGAILFGASNIQMNHPNTGGNATIYFDGQPLTEITINNDVSFGAFYKFTQFTSVVFGEGCTSIGSYAFEGDAALESIELQEGVTSIGQYAFQNCKKVKKLVLPSTITNLRAGCFNYCGYDVPEDEIVPLDIELPNLSTAGDPQNFQYCLLVRSVVSLGNLTAIPQQFFNFCSNLVSAVISEKVVSLGNNAFARCTKLKSLDFKGVVPPTMGNTPFYQVPNGGVMTVPAGAYFNYQNLDSNWGNVRNWTLNEKYSEDGYVYVYYHVSDVSVPTRIVSSITSLDGPIELYQGEQWVEIPKETTYQFDEVGDYLIRIHDTRTLFYLFWNSNIPATRLVLPSSMTGFAVSSMQPLPLLSDIVLPPTFTSSGQGYSSAAFNNLWIFDLAKYLQMSWNYHPFNSTPSSGSHHLFLNGKEITELVIPEDVTSIPAYAFNYCKGITSINIPDGVTRIDNYAFNECGELTHINIPSSVKTIGTYAFTNITSTQTDLIDLYLPQLTALNDRSFNGTNFIRRIKNLGSITTLNMPFRTVYNMESVILPPTLTAIGNYCFDFYGSGGYRLEALVVKATTPPTINSATFRSSNPKEICVPVNSVNAYKEASYWSAMASQVHGYLETDVLPADNTLSDYYLVGDDCFKWNGSGWTLIA